ncbi:MAG TPA: ATP-binding protein [Kofleriaceae bacterium]|nr:ATP-binding protein [Kofleriaceae bacterium]
MEPPLDDDLDEVYESAPCGLFSMTPDGVIVRINQTLLSWLQASREEIVGRRFQDLLTMAGQIFHDTHFMPLLAMQGFAREIAFEIARPGAPPVPTLVTTTARRDPSGRVELYRAVVFEASSRRSYEQELLRQRRAAEQEATARSALLAMLSHDIRSPLASVLMALDLLDGAATPEARTRYVQVARKAASSMRELLDAILDHSRLEAGASVWEPQPTDLRSLLGEIVSIHSVNAETKGIELRMKIDAAVPERVMADRFKLGQIVANLVSNAIKFTEHGHVEIKLRTVRLDQGDAELELRVSDTGIGISPEQLDAVFEEYQQASSATARRYGGSGLGLAISRKLAALAGTTIHVESKLGAGSTFTCTLRLPLARAGAQALSL